MKVKALDTYKRLNIRDAELDKIPEAGEIFEITKERYYVLTHNNAYNEVFVEEVHEIETAVKKNKSEKAIKKVK
jgi:hypothetical protein|nr:MAG TPA: hypothetical protein [Caudoviricetes sp.]